MEKLSLYEKCLLRIEIMKLFEHKMQIENTTIPYKDKYNTLEEIRKTEKYIRKAMKGEL